MKYYKFQIVICIKTWIFKVLKNASESSYYYKIKLKLYYSLIQIIYIKILLKSPQWMLYYLYDFY